MRYGAAFCPLTTGSPCAMHALSSVNKGKTFENVAA
jgi:hypothetical protein